MNIFVLLKRTFDTEEKIVINHARNSAGIAPGSGAGRR